MRKHGWQLPYHPLQVVAVAVFLALGFAFYVFFVPFVGRKVFQYVVMGLYTPLITCVFCLYIWCAAADSADPGVFNSKKYLHIVENGKRFCPKETKLGDESTSSINDANVKSLEKGMNATGNDPAYHSSCCRVLLGMSPCTFTCCLGPHDQSSEQQMSEDGMFYCSLCEVEVFKYSKHCRVCDKCVNHFDHHCRWLNNCIGKKNYRQFFILMVSALLLLILQWSVGILVLIRCFIERKRFAVEIAYKLGSSFSFPPFVVVVASCTILAMIATLPVAQLSFFHVLLIKKGISTYDYIIALREQEQQGAEGQQSPQMSLASSLTGLSSASSFTTFHRGAWCTPPRLFLEDQFDVVPPETEVSANPARKGMVEERETGKKNAGTVKISPWALARLNAEEVSRAAAQARKKSSILKPIVRQKMSLGLETDSSFSSSNSQMVPRHENKRRVSKRIRVPADLPLDPLTKISTRATVGKSSNLEREKSSILAPLQLEARTAFHTTRAMSATGEIAVSSPDSGLDSPDIHPFPISSSGVEVARGLTSLPASITSPQKGIPLSRSTSDGYEASGGEDSDRVPSVIVNKSTNWSNLLFGSSHENRVFKSKASSSSSQANSRKL